MSERLDKYKDKYVIDPILLHQQRQIFYGYINGSSIDLYTSDN